MVAFASAEAHPARTTRLVMMDAPVPGVGPWDEILKAARIHYAAFYAGPGRMHAGFLQFAAFDQDVIDNRAFVSRGRLQMPVLAIGGDHSLGATMAHIMTDSQAAERRHAAPRCSL